MSDRDELARIIANWPRNAVIGPDLEAADRVIRSGYRKPRMVTTIEELNALSPGALVKTAKCEQIWQRQASGGWVCLNYGDDIEYIPDIIIGPAVLLHNPGGVND